MVYETTLMIETELPLPFTVADGTAVALGTVMKLSDPLTAAPHSSADDTFAGIAAAEKIASDGKTSLALFRGGWHKMTLSGNVTAGDAVVLDTQLNTVKAATSANPAGDMVGIALENGATSETIMVEVRPGVANPFI